MAEFNTWMHTLHEAQYGQDILRLQLFPHTLKGNAQIWLRSLPPRSITTWNTLYSKFLQKYYPPTKTNALKNQIQQFKVKGGRVFTWHGRDLRNYKESAHIMDSLI